MKNKVAIIGCGLIGEYHLDHFLLFDDIELVGFCDVIIDKAEAFAKKAGVGKAFSDFVDMYDEVSPDMVFICVPPTVHGYIEFESIRRGIHFFVEKPLSLDAPLAKEIIRRVEENNIIAASGFQCRYDNINVEAKNYIKNNEILHVSGSRIGGIPEVPWWRVKAVSGGQLVEQTIHNMDMLRYLLDDEPELVYSVATRGHVEQAECPGYFTDDVSTTLVTFKSGLTATIVTGCYALGPACWENKFTFGGRDSRMDYRLITDCTVYGKDSNKDEELGGVVSGDGMIRSSGGAGVVVKCNADPGIECDRTFIDAVMTGDSSKIRSIYADAWKSVAFCLACNESMETGLPVKVKY